MLDTLKIRLLPNEEQKQALIETMKNFNLACNYVSEIAFRNKTYSKVKLQNISYYDVREKFQLSSQMTVRVVGKVSKAYKDDMNTFHYISETDPIIYDKKLLSFNSLDEASILTIKGRITIPIVIGSYHKGLIFGKRVRGQADIIYKDNIFYILLVVENNEEFELDTGEFNRGEMKE